MSSRNKNRKGPEIPTPIGCIGYRGNAGRLVLRSVPNGQSYHLSGFIGERHAAEKARTSEMAF